MVKRLYYNDHFIYVKTGVATKKQLSDSLEKVIRKIGLSCRYDINLVMITDKITHKELYAGFAHVWLENVIVSYLLTNRNPDGTLRFAMENGKRVYYDPLVTLPGYRYTMDQYIHLSKLSNNVPKMGYFQVSPNHVSDAPNSRHTSILVGVGIPNHISEKELYNIFSRYSSSNNYPSVNIQSRVINGVRKNIAIVKFNNNTHDGKFALIMTKRLKFDENIVYFNYYTKSHIHN